MRRKQLLTERLRIEELPPTFAAEVAEFHRSNWSFHRRWEPQRDPRYFTASSQRKILRHERKAPDVVHFWLRLREQIGDVDRGRIVGSVTLSGIVRGFLQSCYLGYKIDARVTRRGLMSEALRAVVSYAFESEHLHRIEANVMGDNTASMRLLERLGFRDEGVASRYLQIQGFWEDHVHMVMLSDEWDRLDSR